MVDIGRDHHWQGLSNKYGYLKQVPTTAMFGPKRKTTSQILKSSLRAKYSTANSHIKNTLKKKKSFHLNPVSHAVLCKFLPRN